MSRGPGRLPAETTGGASASFAHPEQIAIIADADDRRLVPVLARDPAALEEFYRRHVRPLTRHVTRRLGNPHDAANVVASTFLAAMESSAAFDAARGKPIAWLYGIAGNVMAMRWRRGEAESRAVARLLGRRRRTTSAVRTTGSTRATDPGCPAGPARQRAGTARAGRARPAHPSARPQPSRPPQPARRSACPTSHPARTASRARSRSRPSSPSTPPPVPCAA